MKKPVIIACAVLLFITGGAIANSLYISRLMDEAAEAVLITESAWRAGERERALSAAQELMSEWEARLMYMEVVLPHAELDRVEEELTNLLSAAKQGDGFTLLRAAAQLLSGFRHLSKYERPSLGNLL